MPLSLDIPQKRSMTSATLRTLRNQAADSAFFLDQFSAHIRQNRAGLVALLQRVQTAADPEEIATVLAAVTPDEAALIAASLALSHHTTRLALLDLAVTCLETDQSPRKPLSEGNPT